MAEEMLSNRGTPGPAQDNSDHESVSVTTLLKQLCSDVRSLKGRINEYDDYFNEQNNENMDYDLNNNAEHDMSASDEELPQNENMDEKSTF